MVSSAHPLATEAGIKVLAKGGTAMDAAVAVAYSLAVVYPRAGNIGGGGFLVYRTKEGKSYTLDFREKAPQAAYRDMYLDEKGEIIPDKSLFGALSVGVPGTVKGLETAHAKFGVLPFDELLRDPIKYAKRGYRIGTHEAKRLNKYAEQLKQLNSLDIPFVKNDLWRERDLLKQKQLGNTLEKIARLGSDSFYKGSLGRALSEFILDQEGLITADDLEAYSTVWRQPLIFDYKDYTFHSMPLPSSGGMTLAQILFAIESYQLTDFQSVEDVHLITEAERRAYAIRAKHLGDPDYVEVPVEKLLDKNFIAKNMTSFDPELASSSDDLVSGDFDLDIEGFETTHFSIIDAYGNSIALTTTLNSNYGSKLYFPEGGFFLNNEMDDFSAKPGVPNQFGLIGTEANAIEPGKRMLSSMTPTIIEKDGKLYMLLGSPGGSTIITSVLQVFLNVSEYNQSLQEAINAPRFHHQWLPDRVIHESGLSKDLLKALEAKGHKLKQVTTIGLVDACLVKEDGTLVGGADPRGEDDARGAK
jgi:gamma-glutamyltranspeptidase/glutathione hydrolase